ncbi:isopentenyl-diphosphate delta-isomerase [Paracrocinitomix mangrovi]|uniref:isopentenyl-diphosphate delta-isomerase n=1 Tax=Paracrocinitomix mangrovi TaxID=2862509 RepID=UPI001C8E557C|nr:isopentenyl-diphosphate delta-isomerase [Paracrocinitomix mangrovi]UKN02486.1 isopentenyl-diphosphate delta-isomerase [Paracrocinitomix mangrovi]
MEKIEHESLEAADNRKQSHLDLAFESQSAKLDDRFYYEPMLSGHPTEDESMSVKLGNKTMKYPIWISSMTGGTSKAGPLNKMLAKTAAKYGFGMGLGSCRIILEDNTYFEDFNLRPILGDEVPFYANVGIAQIERILQENKGDLLKKLVEKLSADGLIVHVNPLQEWLQPEGDLIQQSPLVTIQQLLNEFDKPIIVKEVGQGFGPKSMGELLKLPLMAVDFAANGGTNFSKLELIRNKKLQDFYGDVVALGHSAEEMVTFLNDTVDKLASLRKCNHVIISGGVKNFLDGYYLISKSELDAVYGQAAPFLKYANESQEALDEFAAFQIKGLQMAQRLLRVK